MNDPSDFFMIFTRLLLVFSPNPCAIRRLLATAVDSFIESTKVQNYASRAVTLQNVRTKNAGSIQSTEPAVNEFRPATHKKSKKVLGCQFIRLERTVPDFVQKRTKTVTADRGPLREISYGTYPYWRFVHHSTVARPLHFGPTGLGRMFLPIALLFADPAVIAAQDDSIYRLPAGTRITVRMDVEINSRVASVGDTFTATVARSVVNRNVVVLPIGTAIEGRVAGVSHAGGAGSAGRLDLVFDKLRLSSESVRNIDGRLVDPLKAPSPRTGNVLSIIGGTVIGAVFGAITRSSTGPLIGAGIGAGAGTGIALARKGRDVRIRADEEFEIILKKEVILPVLDY
jgi:hypothetical protein